MVHLVLCGGVGSRLWPLSRTQLPKQFARILPGESFFEATVRRTRPLSDKLIIASNVQQFFLAASQLAKVGVQEWSAVVEPVGRNTAPAIALACMTLAPNEIVFVTPSDHIVRKDIAYQAAVRRAIELAKLGRIVTFGIRPDYPETGYGYIEADGESVLAFREKPDEATARGYVESGRYWWNSGMFCFRADVLLSELARLSPDLFAAAQSCFSLALKGSKLQPRIEDMQKIPSISIDYAVLEKSDLVSVVACDIGWSDVGSYDSLRDCLSLEKSNIDQSGNISASSEAPVFIDSHHNMVIGKRQVALVGVSNLLVVESPDALLICNRGSSQSVKQAVDSLKSNGSSVVDTFPRVERAWGSHEDLQNEEKYKVVRIEIRPGARLSLHDHKNRQEIWTVLEGSAIATLGPIIRNFSVGETVVVPAHVLHRLHNPGPGRLVVLEAQIGPSIDEDDIERHEDDYE